jgi:hypothetical protein
MSGRLEKELLQKFGDGVEPFPFTVTYRLMLTFKCPEGHPTTKAIETARQEYVRKPNPPSDVRQRNQPPDK